MSETAGRHRTETADPAPPGPDPCRSEAEAAPDCPRELLDVFLRLARSPGWGARGAVSETLRSWVARIDALLSAQLNEVLHHPDFQRLEAAWRGLRHLVTRPEDHPDLRFCVLNCTRQDLLRDQRRAVGFDQTALFGKVHEEPYRTPCGTPFALLVGDYEFGPGLEDVSLLEMIAGVAAAAHAPFIAAASPRMFGCERFAELTASRDLSRGFHGPEFAAWRAFRESEASRYAALTLPRVLARPPHGEESGRGPEFSFRESRHGRGHDGHPWMSAAWAYAANVADAFARCGWLARTRGVEGGGKVEGLPAHTLPTDDGDVASGCSCEIAISDRREFELSSLGFLPLFHSKNRDFAAFLGAHSCNRPRTYIEEDANANAALSSKINYLLCASRFVHYLKVMARDRIGRSQEVADCERRLNRWISNYVMGNIHDVSDYDAVWSKMPLEDAKVPLSEIPGGRGLSLVACLRPAYQLEMLRASMRLVAEVPRDAAFRPAPIDPAWLAWNDGTAPRIASAIRREGRFADLPILADALEEAGCADERILEHLREGPAVHVHGCWVLDALVGPPPPRLPKREGR